jgi:chromatin remodeling complex protein RSC6
MRLWRMGDTATGSAGCALPWNATNRQYEALSYRRRRGQPPSQPVLSKRAQAYGLSTARQHAVFRSEPMTKTPVKKAAPKGTAVEKPKAGHKPNALQQPLQPSEDLAAVVGGGTMARGEVVSKVWEYIKANKLQNPDDGREIIADDKLRKVFGKDKVTMFEMNKFLAQHLK